MAVAGPGGRKSRRVELSAPSTGRALSPQPGLGARCLHFPPLRASALTERMRADIGQEQLFKRIAETLDGRAERQPFDRDDVLHQFIARLCLRSHEPELHHLRPAAHFVGDGTEELADLDAKAGFLHYLPPRARDRTFVGSELAAGQHPKLVLAALDDSHSRPRALAHRNSTHRMYRSVHKRAHAYRS